MTFFVVRGSDEEGQASAAPVVGGDLHTLTAIGDALYVGGHVAVAVSHDGGLRWEEVPSLANADAMGWAPTTDALLAGGHPGLFRSTDGGGRPSPRSRAPARYRMRTRSEPRAAPSTWARLRPD